MGASGWHYYVPYQPDLDEALASLRDTVFASGDYWWAVPYEFGKSAADFPNRPKTEEELWSDEAVQESGTHSILDVNEISRAPSFGAVVPVTDEEALARAGTVMLTREHVEKLEELAAERWVGRLAVLHDAEGKPAELFFWGFSGD
ncbi:hypothetical protein [Paractinoplanes hotanensis]|uniref:Uncharacterized protein n=1 Tax=Paractinoplanes hotanensis TaxID=2906497 RepID=A0ABT0Y4Z0_9ACTN|nr:hypothetical protein [Actinoplanes hotanensis]MCM4080885.1 hypothetical protein [Actinoplanes hotanensis]